VRWLLVAGVFLPGCPQLLDDDFSLTSLAIETGGTGPCSTPACVLTNGDAASGGNGGIAGSGGVAGNSGAAGSAGVAGNGGAAGSAAGGGDGGSSVVALVDGDAGATPDAAVAPPDTASVGPDCRIVTLSSSTHSSADNCVGIHGWNSIQNGPGSTLTRTYQNGEVCFSGGVSNSDWGAVYNLTLANEDEWNANTYGATGFDFEFTGSGLPDTLTILYTSSGDDYCRAITPTATVSVAFSSAHPCQGGGSSTPGLTELTILQLNFTPYSSYSVDFCVQIRALP
jgi:hypothetical protein